MKRIEEWHLYAAVENIIKLSLISKKSTFMWSTIPLLELYANEFKAVSHTQNGGSDSILSSQRMERTQMSFYLWVGQTTIATMATSNELFSLPK